VLVFFSTSGHGFQVEYPSISLHAVSRGDSVPSIYCQLDESGEEQNGANEEEEEFSEMRELRIIPSTSDSRMRVPFFTQYHLTKKITNSGKYL